MKLTNEEKAQRELDCFMYCMYQALEEFKHKNYKYSAVYLENAARSLRELEELKTYGMESGADHESPNVYGVAYINIDRGFRRY